MQEEAFSVTFWGVRGGYPKPGPATNRFGGNTTCIEVRAAGRLLIFDAGTGIIALGNRLAEQHRKDKQPIVATMLFTHTHHDHTQGYPFFAPALFGSSVLHIFGPRAFHEDLEAVLARSMLPSVFPVTSDDLQSLRVTRNVSASDIIVLPQGSDAPQVCNAYREREKCCESEATVRILRSYAHPQGVLVYRVEVDGKRLVIATDVEGYAGGDKRLINFARNADVLIHDGEYTAEEYLDAKSPRQGWGHSTWEMAVEVAQAAGAKRLVLTHHNVHHDDAFLEQMERDARAVFPEAIMAYEGLKIEI
ncbi:MAG: MBL fold metallo-hydrolase [Anaerolineae bacterium]|nr:MBL fold metallo-hydrolase [Anaerolineae bacterium]